MILMVFVGSLVLHLILPFWIGSFGYFRSGGSIDRPVLVVELKKVVRKLFQQKKSSLQLSIVALLVSSAPCILLFLGRDDDMQ